jgi:hypothetical protein
MNRFSIARNLVLLGALALGGCFAQGDPEEVGQTNDPRSELNGGRGSNVAHSERNVGISKTSPLGADVAGPQPEPWTGDNLDGDPNGPQPEPWKNARRVAPDPDNASAPNPPK